MNLKNDQSFNVYKPGGFVSGHQEQQFKIKSNFGFFDPVI